MDKDFILISNKRKFFIPKSVLRERLLMFQDNETIFTTECFESLSPVPIEIFDLFIKSLTGEVPIVDESNVYYYLALCLEFGYPELLEKCQEIIENAESPQNVIKQLLSNDEGVDRKLLEKTISEKFDISFLSDESFFSLQLDSIINILQNQTVLKQNDFFHFIINQILTNGETHIKLLDLIEITEISIEQVPELLKISKYLNNSDQKWVPLISNLSKTVLSLQKENALMKKRLDRHKDLFQKSFPMDRKNRGVIDYLKRSQANKFERKFIVSQSSRDLYNLIDKNSKDIFCSGRNNFWIRFDFEKPISIVAMKLQSTDKAFLSSFVVSTSCGDAISVSPNDDDDDECQIPHKVSTFHFANQITPTITITQRGDNPFELKHIEFASLDDEFPSGVFDKLVKDANGDPHKARVRISAMNFDFETFSSLSELTNISTLSEDANWIQIEFLEGKMNVQGYRLKRVQNLLLRGWKIIGSDDANLPVNEWTIIDDRFETIKEKYQVLDYFEVNNNEKSFSFLRLFTDVEKWNGTCNLTFSNIDFYGVYYLS